MSQPTKNLPRYDVLQPEYNLYDRASFDGPLRNLCIAEEIGVITYFSLARGFLSGKYRSHKDLEGSARGGGIGKYLDGRGMRILGALDEVAAETGNKPAEIALAWIMARKGVTAPIASATNLAQLESLIKSASIRLSDEACRLLKATKASRYRRERSGKERQCMTVEIRDATPRRRSRLAPALGGLSSLSIGWRYRRR